MKNCKAHAKKLIDEMHPEDVAALIPIIEQMDILRETIEVLEDPEAMADLRESQKSIKQGKVTALADL
ncbi:hypothetical protein HYR53_01830 [Candidatus Acetothermia bacterium]|nr:hypothetical protein [Candidatus Acetothermia bacterium]